MCVCVCVCLKERERERVRQADRQRERESVWRMYALSDTLHNKSSNTIVNAIAAVVALVVVAQNTLTY